MKERPILFSGAMIRAILTGQKTQTRRVVKPQPYIDAMGNFCWDGWNFGQDFNGPHIQAIASPIPSSKTGRVHCPYGKPGDRLWVRESWFQRGEWNPYCGPEGVDLEDARWIGSKEIVYAADRPKPKGDPNKRIFWRSRPSIHLPRWASRILLEVVTVRVEHLQDISEADAEDEGIDFLRHVQDADETLTARDLYECLWDSINGDSSWAANPWVWVVEFKRAEEQPR